VDPSSPSFVSWKKCEDIRPGVSDKIYIKDMSTPSDGAGVSITSRDWSVIPSPPGIINDINNANDPLVSIIMDNSQYTITLIARDNVGREGWADHKITIGKLLPEYKEISPFTSFKEINISNVSSFLKNIFH